MTDPDRLAERLRAALDLFAAGVDMKRQELRREHPGATVAEIAERLRAWLGERPCDAWGREIDPSERFA